MTSYKANIMLDRFNEAEQTTHNGKQGIFIPFEPNDVFVSEKGHCYVKLSLWINKTGPDQKGNTHTVKLSASRDWTAAHPQFTGQNSSTLGSVAPIVPKLQQQMPYQQAPPPGYAAPYPGQYAPQGYPQPQYPQQPYAPQQHPQQPQYGGSTPPDLI